MLASGSGAGISRHPQLLTGINHVTYLYCYVRQMQVGALHLAAILTAVFHGDGFPSCRVRIMVHRHHLAAVLRGQHRLMVRLDVNALVHLLLGGIHRILAIAERRGDEEKLLSLHRKGIPGRLRYMGSRHFSTRIILHPERPTFCPHLSHHLTVILVQSVGFNDALQTCSITAARGIAGTLNALRPSLVVVRRQREALRITLVLLQELRVMLITVTHAFVLTEFLVGPIIRIDSILSAILQPRCRSLDAKVVVAFARQLALSVAALQYGLRQDDGGRNPIHPHLFFGFLRILCGIRCVLSHKPISLDWCVVLFLDFPVPSAFLSLFQVTPSP